MCQAKKNTTLNKSEMRVEILPDGSLRVETGDMGGVHHKNADQFLQLLSEMMGGEVESASAKPQHGHHHHHDHTHEGGGHQHH